jgi:MoaA/NifB/PqqE/SkfB family radical SAM enzyme
MEKNLEELPEILKIAIDMGIDRLKGHHLWITWPELKNESLKRNTESIRRWNDMVDKLYDIKKNTHSNIKLDNIHKLSMNENTSVPRDWICPFLGREAWISWDGTFNVCCAPDKLRSGFGYFGNINKKDFLELWNSREYTEFITKWGDNPICKNCNMRRPVEEVLL